MNAHPRAKLDDPVTAHMRDDLTCLSIDQTVGDALVWLREHPPAERIIYFYVVDHDKRLLGVIPTRRLILSPPKQRLNDIMAREMIALPHDATVLDACEFFIQHRLLAFPVVDAERRIIGVVDVDLYTDELIALESPIPLKQLFEPLARFLRIESSSGIVLLVCAIVALIVANSPYTASFHRFWENRVGMTLGPFELYEPLLHWVNHGLMSLFFFVVGLEIKREIVAGELSTLKKATLPIVAAIGGMLVPALIYLAMRGRSETAAGWGIPVATDIAFVVGFLGLFGSRVPHSLKVLVLTIAIVDDIGAALLIALVYSTDLSLAYSLAGMAGLVVVALMRWGGVRSAFAYILLAGLIWLAFDHSGIHPTIGMLALGLTTPARPQFRTRMPLDVVSDMLRRLGGQFGEKKKPQPPLEAPLDRLEDALHPWAAFVAMPIFALANAGVPIAPSAIVKPTAIAISLGLIVGKPLGIVLASWLSQRARIAQLPADINFRVLAGAGCLAGVGFTMSLFIAGIALRGQHLEEAKIGIIAGSAVSAILGMAILHRFLQPHVRPQQ